MFCFQFPASQQASRTRRSWTTCWKTPATTSVCCLQSMVSTPPLSPPLSHPFVTYLHYPLLHFIPIFMESTKLVVYIADPDFCCGLTSPNDSLAQNRVGLSSLRPRSHNRGALRFNVFEKRNHTFIFVVYFFCFETHLLLSCTIISMFSGSVRIVYRSMYVGLLYDLLENYTCTALLLQALSLFNSITFSINT